MDSHTSAYIWYPMWGKDIYIDLRKLKLSWGQLTGCLSHAGHGVELSWSLGLSTAWYIEMSPSWTACYMVDLLLRGEKNVGSVLQAACWWHGPAASQSWQWTNLHHVGKQNGVEPASRAVALVLAKPAYHLKNSPGQKKDYRHKRPLNRPQCDW